MSSCLTLYTAVNWTQSCSASEWKKGGVPRKQGWIRCHLFLFSYWMKHLISLTCPDPNLAAGLAWESWKLPALVLLCLRWGPVELLSCFVCSSFSHSNLSFCTEWNYKTGEEGQRAGSHSGQSCNTGKVCFGTSSDSNSMKIILLPRAGL